MRVISEMPQAYGMWRANGKGELRQGTDAFKEAMLDLKCPVFIVDKDGVPAVATGGTGKLHKEGEAEDGELPLCGFAPPLPPENFGDPAFKRMVGIRYPYVAGAMANGITSVEMVAAAAKAGMVGFFGAAGLAPSAVEQAIDRLQAELQGLAFGMNLIHSPGDPNLENQIVNLYLKKGVRLISASAYMRLTPYIVMYRVKGIHIGPDGEVVVPNKVVAKVSRVEVASRFFSPPPEKILSKLVEQGLISAEEASLAVRIPMADALTAEADSGGHTDNRPALALLPTMLALRDEICARHPYTSSITVGLGGGIATPAATAAAFSMGAGYVITGSVNQSCIEAGVCGTVRQMLVEAGQADVTMAPAADMFEMGGKVQVLKRGTMFAMRASKLHDCYVRYRDFDQLPQKERENIEKNFLRRSFEEEWAETRKFFQERDPRQVERAEKDPRHKMALVFRSYLGRSSMWGVTGDPDRKVDYQIWCGPAIGAFNEWVKGSFLEKAENRDFTTVALNLLVGAAVVTRAAWLRNQGIQLPPAAAAFTPMRADTLAKLLAI
ncbi:MAG: PfaD family polyunsaturated fatty acid/polyketide biosynthesis protein [Thermodesulfobacteriota bacterium]|nr:PfaD family polyunsaturated fatty acid/polyketide biosynthesis protein [Thermodesulfobacteriota bacterium]